MSRNHSGVILGPRPPIENETVAPRALDPRTEDRVARLLDDVSERLGQRPQVRQISTCATFRGCRRRLKYDEIRAREYLTEDEIENLLTAAHGRRHGHRDRTMILVATRHGLRASELADLKWEQINFNRGHLLVRRVKKGTPSVHPIPGRELRWLRQLKREQRPETPYVFVSERGSPFTIQGIGKMVREVGRATGMPFPIHPHMLRHSCGHKLGNDGQATHAIQQYLGHNNIQHTARYTRGAVAQFKHFWRD
jgi:integrase